MADGTPIRWWRVASHLWKPGLVFVAAGAPPAIGLVTWTLWCHPGMITAALAIPALVLTGAMTFVGVALLCFAVGSVALGRLQWALRERRTSRMRSCVRGGPYR